MTTASARACPECGLPVSVTRTEAGGAVHTAFLCVHCGAADRGFLPGGATCAACGAPAWSEGWCVDHAPAPARALLG